MGKPIFDAIGVPLLSNISGGPLGWNGAFVIAAVFVVASATCMLFAKKDKRVTAMEEAAAKEMAEK